MPDTAPRRRPPTTTLLIGPTGSGKTSLLFTLAEYLWETYKKVLALASCDTGGFPSKVQALVYKGLIRVFAMRSRGYPFDTMDKVTKGYWPVRVDPETGHVERGVQMVPPVRQRYDFKCPAGHTIRRLYKLSALTPMPCKECKRSVPVGELHVDQVTERVKGMENVGGWATDGFTSAEAWILEDLSERTGRLQLAGEKSALGGVIVDGPAGEYSAGGNNRAQVGFAQDRAAQWASNLTAIPGLMVSPVATALTNEFTPESGLTIIGPKLAGQAKTEEAPQWFGNCLEVGVTKDDDGKDVRRVWLTEFVDDRGLRHLIKHRAGPGHLPAYIEDPPDDGKGTHAFTGFNLGSFFRMLEEAVQRDEQAASEKYPDAPGLPPASLGVEEEGAAEVTLVASPSPAGADASHSASVSGPAGPPTAPAAPPSAKPPVRRAITRKAGGPPAEPAPAPTAVTSAPVPVVPAPARPVGSPLARPSLAPPPGRRPAPSPVRLTGGGPPPPPK